MHRLKFIAIVRLIVIFCLGFVSVGIEGSLNPQRSKTEKRTVFVDVLVTKSGEFVKDLNKNDFTLYEDGKRVSLNSIQLVNLEKGGAADSQPITMGESSGLPPKKLVVIFHDVYLWGKNIEQRVEEIFNELIPLMDQGNEIMALHLSLEKGLEILHPFTTEVELLRTAVLNAPHGVWQTEQDFGTVINPQSIGLDMQGTRTPEIERAFLRDYLNIERQRFEKAIGGLLAALNMMNDWPGKKSILLISEGFTGLSASSASAVLRKTAPSTNSSEREALAARREILDTIHTRDRGQIGEIRLFDPFNILKKGDFKSGDEVIREVIHFANSQHISIYTLDPGTLASSTYSGSTAEYYAKEDAIPISMMKEEKLKRVQNLRWISEETGAMVFRGANKFDTLRQVMNTDLNFYYRLSYPARRTTGDDKYHELEARVNRSGVDVRYRKGYTDYSANIKNKMLLVSAFYNPALFKDLPFQAEFIPFFKDSKKYESWINLALPVRKLFLGEPVIYGPRNLSLHVWIKGRDGSEYSFWGEINLPFNIDSSFVNFVKNANFLLLHFKGSDISLKRQNYQAVFAVYDQQANKIGTWESLFDLPDYKNVKGGAIINCVIGYSDKNPDKKKESFSLNKKNGSLEYGQIKFLPQVVNNFSCLRLASIFLQIYLPQGKIEIQPEFKILQEEGMALYVPGEMAAQSWDKKAKVWSGIFNLNLSACPLGENLLRIEIPLPGNEAVLSKDAKLTVLNQ